MLTIEEFSKYPNTEIFRTGIISDSSTGCNYDNSGKLIKFVAKKGQIEDWAIYVGPVEWSYDDIRDWGNKLKFEDSILSCLNVSSNVLEKYRF